MGSLYRYEKHAIDEDLSRAAREYFGSVALTSVNLYMAVTGGTDWSIYYHIIERCGTVYTLAFVFYIFFFSFALFNILTGVLVQKAFEATNKNRDELILEQSKKTRQEAKEFRNLCTSLDTDNSGTISFNEFVSCMEDERMSSYMATVGLEVHDVELFFQDRRQH